CSAHWNRGYVTEALACFIDYCFTEKGFDKVYASFFVGNEASKRVMEKCGMTYDRFSPKELTYLDKERDLIYYVKTKS
ncbi:MAG: GNAT family N-acetyltransferase, partial [Clostridia bacterium]|nr:GNAT family N-acetyltransferase [Clostridia bacterium]